MRKYFSSILLFIFAALAVVSHAYAASPSAGNIFATIGGTTSIDRGGVAHSQARSIYSLGGGMVTASGKRVSLMAADPPSFSAGCTGISWHFGGFSFISVDEIRQMVEAISQASLGIVIDLAMSVLCPQCYAVMNKLRDMANSMRNSMADACSVARNFGASLKAQFGLDTVDKTKSDCSTNASRSGEVKSALDSVISGVCSTIDKVSAASKDLGDTVDKMLTFGGKGVPAGKPTPSAEDLGNIGNRNYEILTGLGYADGFAKNVLLSVTGMLIYPTKTEKDCTSTIKNIRGTSTRVTQLQEAGRNYIIDTTTPDDVVAADPNKEPSIADGVAAVTEAKVAASDGKEARVACMAPPLLTDVQEVGRKIMCGFDTKKDINTFAKKWAGTTTRTSTADFIEKFKNNSLGSMCQVGKEMAMPDASPKPTGASKDNPYIYFCDGTPTGKNTSPSTTLNCTVPKLVLLNDALNGVGVGSTPANTEYTGLAWMILDALYSGVVAVKDNDPRGLPEKTIKILNGSDYPLYRVINMGAVYPGTAEDLLIAYGAVIAAQYTMDTLSQLMLAGGMVNVSVKPITNTSREEILMLRSQIQSLVKGIGPLKDVVLMRLNEKRALVDIIVQVNKALQSEVVMQGLGGNVDMAVSLKRQAAGAASAAAAGAAAAGAAAAARTLN